jgi:hypothetical protein
VYWYFPGWLKKLLYYEPNEVGIQVGPVTWYPMGSPNDE